MKKEEFLNYPWHDTEILGVVIDRRQPGDKDTVEISVQWPDGSYALLCFVDCYAAKLQMNFGVVCTETILSADYVEDRQDIAEIKNKWSSAGEGGILGLVCFEIETNSTASNLRIYAMDCFVTAIQSP